MKYIENLNNKINAFLEDEANISALEKSGNLLEFKRASLAVKYLIEKNIALTDDAKNAEVSFSLFVDKQNKKYLDEKIALMGIQSMVLSNLVSNKAILEGMSVVLEDKAEQKATKKAIQEIDVIAEQIMPDYLLNAYSVIKSMNKLAVIYNQNDEMVFDFDKFFDSINQSARNTYPVNNSPTFNSDVEAKFKKTVRENLDGFMGILPDVIEKQKRALLENERAPKPVSKVNSDIRKLRRESRPIDWNGEEYPSYLDYIKDDGNFVSFEEFQNTPTARVFNEFDNQEDYVNYVTSSKFAQYVEYLEQPLKSREIKNGTPYFVVKKKGSDYKVQDGEELSDYATDDYSEVGRYPKEIVYLPKKEYKAVKDDEFITARFAKIKNEKVLNAMKKVVAGAMAVVILANALGTPVKEVLDSVKGNEVVDPIVPPAPPTPVTPVDPIIPITPVNPTPDTNNKNTEVKTDQSEIKDNPAHEITPEVDNMGDDGTIKPNLPEDITTGEQPSEGEDNSGVQEEVKDPSYDDPDGKPAEENGIGSDKKNESSDDEFFN